MGRFDRIVARVIERWIGGLVTDPAGLDLSTFLKIIGADRVGEYIRTQPFHHQPSFCQPPPALANLIRPPQVESFPIRDTPRQRRISAKVPTKTSPPLVLAPPRILLPHRHPTTSLLRKR